MENLLKIIMSFKKHPMVLERSSFCIKKKVKKDMFFWIDLCSCIVSMAESICTADSESCAVTRR